MTAWPSRSRPTSASDGFWTLRTTSDWPYRSAVETIRAPALRVGRIGNGRAGAGAGLDEDLEPGRRQLAEHLGYQGDAPFTRRRFPGDTDLHEHHLSLTGRDWGSDARQDTRACAAP